MQHIDLNASISIILGGMLAIVGGIAGTYFTHYLTKKSEERKLRRERIEEIYKLATGVSYWIYAPVYDKLGWETSSLYRSYYRSEPTREPKQDIERIKLIVGLYCIISIIRGKKREPLTRQVCEKRQGDNCEKDETHSAHVTRDQEAESARVLARSSMREAKLGTALA